MVDQQRTQDIHYIEVEATDSGARLDVFLSKKLPGTSRSRLQQMLVEELIHVNGKPVKASYKINPGDKIDMKSLVQPKLTISPQAKPPPIVVIFEDQDLIVINKPAGMVVHPGAGEHGPTVVDALLYYNRDLSRINAERPGIVHRLDKDTTGVLVCAKNDEAHHHLARQFAAKSNFREYLALLDGLMGEPNLTMTSYLARDPQNRLRMKSFEADAGGKLAVTHFRRVMTFRHRLSLVAAQLETGRTHQIRVHARDAKLPVVGDATYHRPVVLPKVFNDEVSSMVASLDRQMLHARYLGFEHPRTGEKLAFEAPLPPDFATLLALLEPFSDQA